MSIDDAPPSGDGIDSLHPDGATPLHPGWRQDLVRGAQHITTMRELDEWEAANITAAVRQITERRARLIKNLLDTRALLKIHRMMFDQTWRWAGETRQIGVQFGAHEGCPPHRIMQDLYQLCGDTKAWTEYDTYSWNEICARFHHKLVLIHPFKNGNGRHSRLATEVLCQEYGRPLPTWGGNNLTAPGPLRAEYLAALHAADAGDFAPLIAFMMRQ